MMRVKLQNRNILKIGKANEITDADVKLKYTGLVVHNLIDSQADELSPGTYVWDGDRWNKLENRPSSLPVEETNEVIIRWI
ncbi:hypothetical protein [Viscerimonas tarda]